MERVQHIAQSPIQLEWMRREMAIAPITPDQSAADWVVQRINLAKERVVQARLAAGAPAATPPAQAEAPKMEPKEEIKPEAKQEVKEEGWNGRMDFDGFYNQNNQGNANDWASNDIAVQDDVKWEHPEGQAMPAAYAVKDEYEGPVSTLTAPHFQPIMMNAQASSSTSNGYVTASLNPALLMQPQAQAQASRNNLKRKASPTASDTSSGKTASNKRLIDLSTNNRLATAVDPSNLRPTGSPPPSGPSKSPPPQPSYDFATVKALLTASNLRLHETPRKLMRLLLDNPKNAKRPFLPKPRELVELLKIIRTGGKSFFEALGAELELLKLLAGWYKLAFKDPELWDGVLPPLLQVITRTPIPIKNLIESKIGFWVKKKLPDGSSDDLKRKRDEAFQHCEKLIVAEQERSAKRARPDPSSASAGPSKPPAPRPVVAPVRPTPSKPAVTSTDMSFFGAEKPTPKPKALPSFKKVAKPAPAPAAPQPSAFASTLGQLSAAAAAKPRSPVVLEPLAAGGKLKKRVRFRDTLGGHLTDVKEFRQEAYEFGDEIDLHGMSSHDMDMEEGKAMRVHGVEEVIDWYDPEPYNIPEPLERGTQSAERAIQDDRERTVLAVTYHGRHEIPPSADESQVNVITEDATTGIFLLPQTYPTEQQAPAPPPPVQTNQNLAELLARIQAGTPLAQMQMQPQAQGYGYAAPAVPQYGAYAMPQAQGTAWGAPQPPQQQQQQRFDRGPAYGKVRGGGGVKGSRTQPCRNFMSAGGCRFGDSCDYAHNEPNRNWYQ